LQSKGYGQHLFFYGGDTPSTTISMQAPKCPFAPAIILAGDGADLFDPLVLDGLA